MMAVVYGADHLGCSAVHIEQSVPDGRCDDREIVDDELQLRKKQEICSTHLDE